MDTNTATKETIMEVTIFGPNLSHAGQAKGDLHVHAAGCADCKQYGPGTKYGGEAGWTITVASKLDAAQEIYPPEDFGYDADSHEALLYVSDLYFAPCCSNLPTKTS